MPLVKVGERTIFFAHVPKTGGSSVQDYLRRRFGPLSIMNPGNWEASRSRGLIIPPTHLSAADLRNLLPHDLTHSFATVRDPLDRLQSEYRFQNGLSRSSRLGFSTWVRLVIAAARSEPRIYMNHIRPQVDLILPNSAIFKIEDGLDKVTAWLDETSGTSDPAITFGHFGKRQHTPLAMYREDLEMIVRYYEKDYRTLGYAPPDPDSLPKDPYNLPRNAFASVLARALVARQRRNWVR
jgi:hypothetical protein